MKKITKTTGDYTCDWYSSKELAEMFLPDSKEIIARNISIVEKDIAEQEDLIIKALTSVRESNTDDVTEFYCKQIIQMELVSEILKKDRFLFQLKSALNFITPQTNNTYIENFQQKLERARGVPIAEIVSQYTELMPRGKDFVGLCVFHSETHPSMQVYVQSNVCHCYSCGKHVDVIQLKMELDAISFREAVDLLSK